MLRYAVGMRGALMALLAASFLWVAPVGAQPSPEAILADLKISEADKQRVLKGELVSAVIPEVSERDLSNSFVFLVKATTPEELAKQLVEGKLTSGDPQVKSFGILRGDGSPADMSGLTLSEAQAQAFAKAKRGSALNLATSEITAFNAAGGERAAVLRTLQEVLLGRYRAYRDGGLTSITPYERGGSITDVAGDLRKATESFTPMKKYLPAFHAMVLDYPKAMAPNARERFFWAIYDVNGTPTYVLTHVMTVTDGAGRAFATRQYYVSQGYNAEQAEGGFLPVQGGTMVIYAAHAFTDQVAGMGGSMKRGIGRRVMAEKLREMFEANRKRIER
jgi:hypothetical protein